MDSIFIRFTPDTIQQCIDSCSKLLFISNEETLDALETKYRGIKDYVACNISLKNKPDSNIVFFYYSGSKDGVLPGYGSGEKIPSIEEHKFKHLSSNKQWRKMLSNFWVASFELDSMKWASVEHYYQGSKFRGTPEYFKLFSLDSKSDISKDPLMAKSAGGKSGKYKGKLLRPKNIIIDKDFFGGAGDEGLCHINMFRAMYAKFSQNKDLKKVLLATHNATLTHGTRGVPTKPVYTLMKVREMLMNEK